MAAKKEGQENRRVVDAGRTVKQTVDTHFYLRFKERVYDGSPRWWSNEWLKHGHGVIVKKHGGSPEHGDNVLDRERDVNAEIARAHDPKVLFHATHDLDYLFTCVYPTCQMRKWVLVNSLGAERSFFDDGFYTEHDIDFLPDERESLWKLIENRHGRMARGTWSDPSFYHEKDAVLSPPLPPTCEDPCGCGNKKALFGVVDITDKWVYVLTGSGGILTPDTEIYIETPTSGEIRRQFEGKRFTGPTQRFNGEFILDQRRILKETWSFFLSPVRLGQKALAMLSESPRKSGEYLKKLESAHPFHYQVGYEPTVQPWAPVVTRVFTDAQVVPGPMDRVYPHEYIPLVDPFAWVAEILELDYIPMLAARQELIQNPYEQAKAVIAATLAPEKGKDHGKSAPEESDPWKLDSTLQTPPSGYHNIAQAWIARHKDAGKYLDDETNYACSRVFYPVKFSPAYRIVEQACQDGPGDPNCLAFGLAHWAHILREMMRCPSGIAFILWLWKSGDAKDRIPQKNVLHGEGIKSGPPDLRLLAAQILAQFGPSIIRDAGADHSEAALKGYLGEIDVEVEADWFKSFMTPDTVKPIPDLASEAAIKHINEDIDHYFKSIPTATEPEQFHKKYLGAASARERIIALTDTKNLLRSFFVLAGLLKWARESQKERYSRWDRYGHVVESIDTWATAADYVVSCGKYSIEEKALSELEKKIGEHAKSHKLGPYAQYKFEASSGLKTLEYLDTAGHILAGPVSLFLGGSEILLQSHEAEEALERGDFNAAAGARLKSFAGAFVVESAVADMLVWAGVRAAAAVVVPIGWIAAGFWLLGELLGAFGAKSDYELFADHCFLGSHPGQGGEGGELNTKFPWLGVLGLADLKDPLHGHRALLRLLSGFSVWVGYNYQRREGAWWQIKSFYIPPGAYFEVEVDFTSIDGGPVEVTRKALIFPDGDGRLVMTDNAGDPRQDGDIDVTRGSEGTIINVEILSGRSGNHHVRGVRVRLVLAPNSFLPVEGWVENKWDISSIVRSDGK